MNDIYVSRVCFPVRTLGPGDRLAIWFSGCKRNCEGCISPEFKMNNGLKLSVDRLIKFIELKHDKIDGFTISGGEPLDQYDGLICLLGYLNQISDDIIVFSGYTYNEIITKFPDNGECLFRNIAVLVDGPFIKELNEKKGLRGSSNQKFYIFKELYKKDYFENYNRSLQTYVYDDRIIEIGIPWEKK